MNNQVPYGKSTEVVIKRISVDFVGDCTPEYNNLLDRKVNDFVNSIMATFGVPSVYNITDTMADDNGIYVMVSYVLSKKILKVLNKQTQSIFLLSMFTEKFHNDNRDV